MKHRKLWASCLIAAMVLTSVSPARAQETPVREETVARYDAQDHSAAQIDMMRVGQTPLYIYVPIGSEWLGRRPCTSPVILVYGDGAYTAETARAEAEETGLANIAYEEGAPVVFVNPSVGSTWNDQADADSYLGAISQFSDDGDTAYVNGKSLEGKYAGAVKERVYIYAEGTGADFVIRNYAKDVGKEVTLPDGNTVVSDWPVTCITVFGTDAIPEKNFDKKYRIPMVYVNASKDAQDAVSWLSGEHQFPTSREDGFDARVIKSTYEFFTKRIRRQNGDLYTVPKYAALGIREMTRTYTVAGKPIEYIEYVPSGITAAQSEKVPLVMIFHDGGSTAEYQAWASEWPLIGKRDGFIVVSVNAHVDRSASEIVELLKKVEKDYPCIDTTRVYASGFSAGAVKVWQLMEQYPMLFAGVAPMSGSEAAQYDRDADRVITPVFYIGGEDSPLPEFPHQAGEANDMDSRIAGVLQVNEVSDSYVYDKTADPWWGAKPYLTFRTDSGGSIFHMNYYRSADGYVYTIFGRVERLSHEQKAAITYEAWDFLKQFSRMLDGGIAIDANPLGPLSYATARNTAWGVRIHWGTDRTNSDSIGFAIQKKIGNTWKTIRTITSVYFFCTDKKANKNGAKYEYRVCELGSAGKGDYSDPITAYFLSPPKITKATSDAPKSVTVRWTENEKADGYEIRNDHNGRRKTVSVNGAKTLQTTYKKLQSKEICTLKVRSYMIVDGVYYYSAWSDPVDVKAK